LGRGLNSDFQWNPSTSLLDSKTLENIEAVIHLAGENVAKGRWNAAKKRRILDSREKGTRLMCEKMAQATVPPKVLLSASAVGFYGSRGDEVLEEANAAGKDFLAHVCQKWESACQPAIDAGIRVVQLRFGVVLSPEGGALKEMRLPFSLGLGGRIGNGAQWMSWIALPAAIGVIQHALNDEKFSGPVNVVAGAVTNADFTKALGQALRRPTWFPLPAFVARLAFGEMAEATLLASTRVEPKKLHASGFEFQHADLPAALTAML
jgi:uncharacterized protein (TIGR01777 family)